MHVPGSRTASHLLKRFVTWPVTDALHHWAELRQRLVGSDSRQSSHQSPTGAEHPEALTLADWAHIIDELSERSQSFFSDNLISNESSYLQAAEALERVPKGLAYIGVGPEQNFSYLATLQPCLAFVVDCRRDNLSLHLLYKALFEEAANRAEWLSLLLGSDWRPKPDWDDTAPLEALLTCIEQSRPADAAFERAHARVRGRLERLNGHLSRPPDWRTIELIHRRFFQERLGTTFRLHTPGRHTYPTLRSLLLARDPNRRARSFLASADRYARVRQLQREHRIVPVVGDFTGYRAFSGIAELLKQQCSSVGVLYASNVEQMIWEQRRWQQWIRNVRALPLAPEAIVLRCYIDQGRPHPRQLPGHRTTTLAQSAFSFLEREQRLAYRDHWDVVADEGQLT